MALAVQDSNQFLFLLGDLFKGLGGGGILGGKAGGGSGLFGGLGGVGGGHVKGSGGNFYVRKGYAGSNHMGPVIASGLTQ